MIISNLSTTNNHLIRIKELFEKSDSFLIASPFLMHDFSDFFEEVNCKSMKDIHLITTLQPKSIDQINKITSLSSLIEIPEIKRSDINCKISINNKLHGKIYIFKENSNPISAVITSANFTANGLYRNHEWGFEINNTAEINNLEKSLLDNLEFEDINKSDIAKMREAADTFVSDKPQIEERKISLSLTDLLDNKMKTSDFNESINYWLKPIGVTDNPIKEGELFNQPQYNLHFSKFRPNGVKPDDILIAYGVGTRKVLSIYKAVSHPLHVTNDEIKREPWLKRWPWFVIGENLFPIYGGKWWQNDFSIKKLVDSYQKFYPNSPITAVGGKSLGGLKFGKDKLNLNYDFASFIIEKITEKNK